MDYKKAIGDYLDEVLGRKEFSIDRIKVQIKNSRYVCVFGIGAISYPIISSIRNFTDIKIDFLSDNDRAKWGKTFHDDLKCISPKELEKYKDDIAILITTQHYKKIYQQLLEKGFKKIFAFTEYRLLNDAYFKNKKNLETIKDNLLKLTDILEDERSKEIMFTLIKNWFDFDVDAAGYEDIFTNDQYYPADIIQLSARESFVDVGAYNGDTLLDFIKKTKDQFDSIFAFELDIKNFKEMETVVDKLAAPVKNNIKLYNFGLLDEEKEVYYETGGSGMQSTFINVINAASACGKTVRLNDRLKNKKVTFIKMDIEGSELKALSGAEEIIKKQKPKLAICVYHKPEHLWEVPLYIKKIVPEYKIFIRHHTPLEYETVCYAVI
ncbi:MAG TPA: FkbM family methyltransferase [Paludibacter sp.]|nr:FkbM family methyltransferase [Paludibacter sp.]